ncbi:hypothetical protein [Variovorax guangxiensis]|uniref:Uncharacterized protein n=1 Tax=Variovorax guangxiensis TaxID=1775474 RepID=A0A840FCM2_9BURK|nr:hypothetical protein [Variovorax guangxiensis]MBB4219263.1 hypothetical protein [Variovorax guangxiensis]
MARSARAFTRTSSLPHSNEEPAAPSGASSKSFPQDGPEAFALQAGDDITSIRDVHSAYACLEKLIAPLQVTDCEELCPTRSELGALVRLINEALHRRIDVADGTISSLREVLRESCST